MTSIARFAILSAVRRQRQGRFAIRSRSRSSASNTEGNYKLLETSKADEAGSEQAERFWRETEAEFPETLDRLAILEDPSDEGHEIRQRWLRDIRRAALRIFDDDIAPEDAWNDDPRRLVYARHNLAAAFNENNKVWKALGLPPPLKPKKQPRKRAGFGARP